MQKRRIKKWPCVVLILIIIGLGGGIMVTKYIRKINSYEYKLEKIGYSEKQINTLIKKLNNKELDTILTKKFNKKISDFVGQKYFIFGNLDKYLKYEDSLEEEKTNDDIIAIINVGANKKWYSDTKEIDDTLGTSMLVNKFYHLTEKYMPNDLQQLSSQYAYGTGQSLRKVAYDAFVKMFNDAKKEDITLIINSSYRSYKEQEEIYSDYSDWYGEEKADRIAARPGFSEHQTGFSADIQTYNSNRNNFEKSDTFEWLDKNAYKYGFILRYPKGKEYLTGYDYESWHFRYVGEKIANYIKKNNITFDEYYAYFIEKK